MAGIHSRTYVPRSGGAYTNSTSVKTVVEAPGTASSSASQLKGDSVAPPIGRRSPSALAGSAEAPTVGSTLDDGKKAEYSKVLSSDEHADKHAAVIAVAENHVKAAFDKGLETGKEAGKSASSSALMWKIPITLLSGVALGLVPAWAIASKDAKTEKRLRDQLTAAQTQ